MRLRNWTVTTLLAGSALTVASGVSYAGPPDPTPPAAVVAAPGDSAGYPVHFQLTADSASVTTTLIDGTFALSADNRAVIARDGTGQVVASIPLHLGVSRGSRVRLVSELSGDARTVTLSPVAADATEQWGQEIATPWENQQAGNESANQLGLVTFFGPMVGALAGAVVGAAVALLTCAVLTIACLVTGLPTIGLFAGAGGVFGTIVLGGATAVWAAWNYVMTVIAPPGESDYADQGGFEPGGAGVPKPQFRVPKLPPLSGGSSG